jgi:hypothetical protein
MTPAPSDAFVPLALAPAAGVRREDFRVLVAERPELARPLRELNPSVANPSITRPNCEPKVSLQREADRITGIHIECSCGQVIELKCSY